MGECGRGAESLFFHFAAAGKEVGSFLLEEEEEEVFIERRRSPFSSVLLSGSDQGLLRTGKHLSNWRGKVLRGRGKKN